ncbi:MAG: glycosyltransferase family 2 protein [Candidatus Omnitrophota bacterium]
MLLSIVVPAHNEEENILDVITRIEKSVSIPHELLIVNDHSTDQTKKLLDELLTKYNNIRTIENKRGKGFANALKTGFANIKGDVVIPVMADLCDDLLVIEKLFSKIEQGYDVACASRYSRGGARQGGSKLKGFLSSFAGRSLHYLLGIPTSDIANAFKMYRKKVLDSMVIVSKSFEISMEIPLKAYYLGFKITEIPTVWNERKKGKSSFRVFKLLPNYLKLYIWAVYKRLRG